jgi:glycosyltransferase involved in cell wall biosynthesis
LRRTSSLIHAEESEFLPPIAATHVGPHVYTSGGTQSVIRTIRDHRIGADRVRVLATWNGFHNARNAGLLAVAAKTLLVSNSSEIVHLHVSNGGGWLREGTLVGVCRARGLRVVVTIHGFDFPEFARARPVFVRRVLGGVNHVIVLSEEARDVVRGLVDVDVSIVPNPVAIDLQAPPAEDAPPVALFAGAVGHRKGVDVLIDAWRLLLERGIDGQLRIVGPPEDITPPGLPQMTVEAAVHPNDVPCLLREVRVIVLPSRAEAMPMILTESLAAGRPFVATAVGGVATITPDPDMLVAVDDAPALAAAIARYLDDAKAAGEAGRRGRQYMVETRSPEVIGAKLRAIYEKL